MKKSDMATKHEESTASTMVDLMARLESQIRTGDFTQTGKAEAGTEAGEIAALCNRILEKLETDKAKFEGVTESLKREMWKSEMLISSITSILICLDGEGRIARWNDAASAAFGVSKNDAIGRDLQSCGVDWKYADLAAEIAAKAQGGKSFRIDDVGYVRPGGLAGFLGLTVSPLGSCDECRGVLILGRDITERKQGQDNLVRLATAIEHCPETILVTDARGVIEYANPAAETVTGYSRDELIGEKPSILSSGKHSREFYQSLWSTIRGGETWSGHFINKRKDGTFYEEDGTITPIKDSEGTIVSYVTVKRDVSKEIALEFQLHQAQKLESIGQLAAGIAHEINTPTQFVGDNTRFLQEAFGDLRPVLDTFGRLINAAKDSGVASDLISQAENVAREADIDYLNEEVPKAIEQSLEGIERVARIVGSMKEFSHPGTDEKTPTDLNAAIASTVTVSTNEWKYVAEIETDFDADLPLIPCLPGDFNQVILNMIVNASHAISDALPENSADKGTIKIATRLDGDDAEIRISDTGTGIPEEIRSKLFDPFFTTKEVGRGTGQGLAISHSVIVDKHSGSVQIESEVGRGTTFIIRLPVSMSTGKDQVVERTS